MALLAGDFCNVNHCQNGGTCLTGINEAPFFCICPEGYVGIDCNETEKGGAQGGTRVPVAGAL